MFRLNAAKILEKIFHQGLSLDIAINNHSDNLNRQELRRLKVLIYGILRNYQGLQNLEKALIPKPLKNKDYMVSYLLWIGLYQLHWMTIKEHSVLSETVDAAKKLKQPWAKNLINACLRRFLKEKVELLSFLEAALNHPDWLIKQIAKDWPNDWNQIIKANNEQAPMYLRINQQKISRSQYHKHLNALNIKSIESNLNLTGMTLLHPMPIEEVPGFEDGWISVQDLSPQCVVPLLDLKKECRVLDACAAPGGKTTHILEIEPSCHLTAIDINEKRLMKVEDNLKRLQMKASLQSADLTSLEWWDGNLFDCILLDAPCSASGVIRRHPDIKILRQPNDIAQLHQIQIAMLENLWKCLKPKGTLVYATCSIFHRENDAVIDAFLQNNHAFIEECDLPNWRKTQFGYQNLPNSEAGDGFYLSKLIKI